MFRLNRLSTLAVTALGLSALSAPAAHAQPYPDSLWIGNDFQGTAVNVDKSGALLRNGPAGSVIGYAVDVANNTLYINPSGSNIVPYNLTTLVAGTQVNISRGTYEDFTFNGSQIVAGNFGGSEVNTIDPTTGAATQLFTLPFANPLGIAYDGSGYWVSDFNSTTLHHFTATGTETSSFTTLTSFGGGVAFDTSDNTLFVGNFGQIYHYTTSGTLLATIAVPNGNAFVDGLEYEGFGPAAPAVPEPGSIALLAGLTLTGAAFLRRRKSASKAA